MAEWQGKSKGTTLGYRIFVAVLKKFGVLPAYFMLRFVALHYLLFSPGSTKNIFNYFHRVLGYSVLKSFGKIYSNYFLFGQSIIDKVVVMSGIPNKFTFHFDGEENLREIVALRQGGLLLSSHIGNWEIAGHLLNRLNARINIVMFDGEHEQIKEYLSSVTGERNMNVILIKDDLSHIYEINHAFSNNELICMHSDRFMKGNKTLSADFLGNNARFPAGPFVLASTFKVPVSYVFAMKETRYHYHFFATKPVEYSGPSREAVMNDMLSDYVGEMENKVKTYPEQWYNYYNFWQN
jgi:predicted LPLAT superfamily acyltransferase